MNDTLTFATVEVALKAKTAFDLWLFLSRQKEEAAQTQAPLSRMLSIHELMKSTKIRADVLQQQEFAVREKLQDKFVLPPCMSKENNDFYFWLAEQHIFADDPRVDDLFQQFKTAKK